MRWYAPRSIQILTLKFASRYISPYVVPRNAPKGRQNLLYQEITPSRDRNHRKEAFANNFSDARLRDARLRKRIAPAHTSVLFHKIKLHPFLSHFLNHTYTLSDACQVLYPVNDWFTAGTLTYPVTFLLTGSPSRT
jgi:hypothetical protein